MIQAQFSHQDFSMLAIISIIALACIIQESMECRSGRLKGDVNLVTCGTPGHTGHRAGPSLGRHLEEAPALLPASHSSRSTWPAAPHSCTCRCRPNDCTHAPGHTCHPMHFTFPVTPLLCTRVHAVPRIQYSDASSEVMLAGKIVCIISTRLCMLG